jgi:hypothetical protein
MGTKGQQQMSDQLDFGDGTWEQAAPMIRTTLEQLEKTVNGNGKPGIKAEVAELKVIAATSLKWVKGIGVVLSLAIALAALYVGYLQLSHRISQTEPPRATTEQTRPVDSSIPSAIATELKGH